jgi:xylan 1,4-beta-xylosidase
VVAFIEGESRSVTFHGEGTGAHRGASARCRVRFSPGFVQALMAWSLALASPALAQAPATVNFSVDASAAGTPLERVWPFHGYDEINYTTMPEGKALLGTIAAAHTAPIHIRSHFLLNTGDGSPAMKWGSTNVYTEDADGKPVYSWTLTDGIMDTITGVGAFPFVELAFMPQALSTHPDPYLNASTTALNSGCFYPPSDYTKWAGLVRAWAAHADERYPNIATRWLWELWNEPDSGYWHGTFADYAMLYDYTESALHGAIPNAALGGPAVVNPGGTFLTQFLEHCATGTNAVTGETGTRLDLITFHAKGGTTITGGHVEMNLGNQLGLHRAGMSAVAAVAAFRQTPIYITEADPDGCAACPVTATADTYRDSPAYGAYEVAMMKRTLELEARLGVKLGGVLTWAFTFPGTPYFAGYRALATNGIDLPVLGAFKLLGSLAGARLPVTSSGALTLDEILANSVRGQADVDGMATLNGTQVQVLVWNYHDDLVTAPATPIQLHVNVPSSFGAQVTVTHLRVDDTHGDAYTLWTAQGSPATPSAAQIAALQQEMDPVPLGAAQTLAVTGGAVSLSFDLPRFGISLLTLSPVGEAADASTDAALTPPGEKSGGGGCACAVTTGGGASAPRVLTLFVAMAGLAALLGRRRARDGVRTRTAHAHCPRPARRVLPSSVFRPWKKPGTRR